MQTRLYMGKKFIEFKYNSKKFIVGYTNMTGVVAFKSNGTYIIMVSQNIPANEQQRLIALMVKSCFDSKVAKRLKYRGNVTN